MKANVRNIEVNLHNGKTMRVSEKRFKKYSEMEENREDWLQFRMKRFGFSREELIMHPSPQMLFFEEDDIKEIFFFRGKFHAGFYCKGRLDDNLFDTPEEAYQFMKGLKGGQS